MAGRGVFRCRNAREIYKNAMEGIFYRVHSIAVPRNTDTLAWEYKAKYPTRELYRIYEILRAEFELRDDLEWRMKGDQGHWLDKALLLFGKPSASDANKEVALPAIEDTPAPKNPAGSAKTPDRPAQSEKKP
jgi:hypothetical protein